ncbi:hypothetical protein FACS189487_05620 [Campylobacterota bacterium]|nr:hypothetical protein FACS189487_05620 [Campylobacterota bacterium]
MVKTVEERLKESGIEMDKMDERQREIVTLPMYAMQLKKEGKTAEAIKVLDRLITLSKEDFQAAISEETKLTIVAAMGNLTALRAIWEMEQHEAEHTKEKEE